MTTQTRHGGGAVRDVLAKVGGTLVGLALVIGVLAPQAYAAPTEAVATTAAHHQVVEVDAAFTPQQQAALVAVLSSPAGRAQIAKALGPVSTAKPGTVSPQVQAGRDGDHWWIKISMAEILGTGISAACKAAFPEIGWFVCPPLGAAVSQAVSQWPNAGGVWAELYTDGRIRVGTW
jgi:hypothetical protein